MNKIFDTPIAKLLSNINDDMLKELYSVTLNHFSNSIPNILLTLPNPNPATFPKFSEDALKEVLFDECVEFLQKITNDTTPITEFPKLNNLLKERVDLCVTKSIYEERGVKLGLPFARWVWQDKLISKISEDMVKFYIVGLVNNNQFNLEISK